MQLHYTSFVHNINTHPIYHSNTKQSLIFIKKCVTAISQTALEIVSPSQNWQDNDAVLEDLQSFALFRKES